MNVILITTLVITAIGCVVGAGLVFTEKKYRVQTDPREEAVRQALPGNNCGACGYAGCDAMAEAIVKGEAAVNGCAIGGESAAKTIADVMGVSAEPMEKKVALIACSGTCDATHNQGNYIGVSDCRSVVLSGLNITECGYGCLGLGSCAKVCPQHAITVQNGVAVVDKKRCVGCGLCVKACPKQLITLVPRKNAVFVKCANRDKGAQVKKVCSAGCIGCGICQKSCEFAAISVENNLAQIDYAACTQCGACANKCPAHVITSPLSRR